MAMPGDIFGGWNAVQNAPVAQPPSSAPIMATLGNMIDALEQRRMARAKEAQEQANFEFQQRKQAEKDAYYRRKLDLQDQRDTARFDLDNAKFNQGTLKEAQGEARKPGGPGVRMWIGKDGKAYQITPRWVPGQAPAQTPDQVPGQAPGQAPQNPQNPQKTVDQPLVIPASLEGTNVVAQALDQNPDADSADELGMGPKLSPEETRAVGEQRQRMLQGDPGGNIDLANPPPPVDYQPEEPQPGASVDPTFGSEDVLQAALRDRQQGGQSAELMSRDGSAKRIAELGLNDPLQEALGERQQAQQTQSPAQQPQAQDFKRGKWVYDDPENPGASVLEIDMEQANQAHQEEIKARVAQLYRALSNPILNRPENAAQRARMEDELAYLEADLGDKATSQLRGQAGKMEIQGAKDAAAGERQQAGLESKERIASAHDAAMLKKAAMRGQKILSAARDKALASGLTPKDMRSVEYTMSAAKRSMNWDKLVGVGKQRLDLALRNASAEGPNAATKHMEALMNFFGYIRGGVPAENETKEWKHLTGTFRNWMDSFGSAMGLDNLFSRYMGSGNDKEYTQAELETVSKMPPQARRSLIAAIQESKKMINGFAQSQLEGLAMKYRSAKPAVQTYVQDSIDGLAHGLGLEMPPQYRLQGAAPAVGGQAAPIGQPQQMGKMSLDDALQKLLQAKGAK